MKIFDNKTKIKGVMPPKYKNHNQSKNIPSFIYGTAWKEKATTELVELAIESGFRAIDTANQNKHYKEPLVGKALLNVEKRGIPRKKLWLQSKFTSIGGQDHVIPYDKKANIETQILQSFDSTLNNLHTDYLDSYLLHGPYNYPFLGEEDFIAWETLEKLYKSGKTKSIGISNVNFEQIRMLVENSKIKPMMVQNRCYASQQWDKEVREFCQKHKIHYQGFSLLTANMHVLMNPAISEIAKKYIVSPEHVIFRFAYQIGMIPLTGTSNKNHMISDLTIFDFKLSNHEMSQLEAGHVIEG